MFIQDFLQKNKAVKISPATLEICLEGERLMMVSPDPLHNHHHLNRLFKNLSTFLRNHPHLKPNFDVLLTALCWHDVWKARRRSLNPLILLYYQIYEGYGSIEIFGEHNKELAPALKKQINYAIRKHAQFQFLPLKTLEAKILRDIDDLDVLNAKRLRPLLRIRNQVSPLVRIIGRAYLKFASSDHSAKATQFPWTREKIRQQNQIVRRILNSI